MELSVTPDFFLFQLLFLSSRDMTDERERRCRPTGERLTNLLVVSAREGTGSSGVPSCQSGDPTYQARETGEAPRLIATAPGGRVSLVESAQKPSPVTRPNYT